jgi:poly(3-hydroxybutyrate) depolymerase
MNKVACSCALLLLSFACAPADPGRSGLGGGQGAGGAGSGGDGGPTGAGGSGGNGGESTAGGGRGGGTGAGAGGRPGSGGSAGAAAAGGGSGSGGAGGSAPAVPSAGCGKAGRPAGGVVTVANDHIYNFPTSYNGTTPMPLLIAFHANGNLNTQLQTLTNSTRLDTGFVRAFPKSVGAGWVLNTDAPRITAMYNDLLASYCIDTSRAFLTGHSSGAQMVVQMLCVPAGEKRFKAVAPVAASKYCNMISPIPAMYIQGMRDAMRGGGNGIDVVNFFTASNGCMSTTTPDTAVPTCNSTLDRQLVTPGCVTYQGCSQPTVWCSHNDNSYNTTDGNMHGWPCFASNAMADFFLGN